MLGFKVKVHLFFYMSMRFGFFKSEVSLLSLFISVMFVISFQLEKLACDLISSLQTRSALQYDDELLEVLSPLLCVFFPHKSKQIRTGVTQFWNTTFGNALVLTYPEIIK